jgi:hypothetical protein
MYNADERKRKEKFLMDEFENIDNVGEEVVNPQETEEEINEEPQENEDEVATEPQKKQSPEQNKAFAEYRKRAEQAERAAKQYEQELQNINQWTKQTFAQYGVNSWQEYQSKMEQQMREQREKQFIDAGIDPKLVRDLIQNDPELNAIKQQNQMLQQQMQEKEQQAKMVSDYGELTKEYPELVAKPEDIPNEVWNLFDKGYSLLDAYEKVNRKQIREYWSKGAKQKVMNDIKGKSHIKTDKANGDEVDSTQIPSEVLDMYKSMMPKKSMKEYIAHYKKNNK